jgi:hypothetical protein
LIQRREVQACQQPQQRISVLYRLLYGRAAEPDEVALGLHFLESAVEQGDGPSLSERTVPLSDTHTGMGLDAWERYTQVLLLANEFVFVD